MKTFNTEIIDLISNNGKVIYVYWSVQKDSAITFVSQNIDKVLGYRNDLITTGAITFDSLIHDDDLFEYQIELDIAKNDPKINEIEHTHYRMLTADGSIIWVQQNTQFVRDEYNNVSGYLGAITNVSTLYQYRDALDKSNKRLSLAMKTSLMGMWQLDIATGIVTCDPSWTQLMGILSKMPPVKLNRIFAMVHSQDLYDLKTHLDDYIKERISHFEIVCRMRHIDGTWRYILNRGVISDRDNDGNPLTFIGAQTDITEQKELEMSAIEALGARNQFFARVSHEIRTPMHGILGILGILKKNTHDDTSLAQIDKVIDNSEQLLNLLNDILDLAKLNETTLSVVQEVCSINEIVQQVQKLFKAKAQAKSLQFEYHRVDSTSEFLLIDKVRLTQVVSNLVSNAIKFTVSGSVKIKCELVNTNLVLSIADTGIGIKDTRTIFEPYRQEHSGHYNQVDSSGLGLEIVKKLCELMDISIAIDSSKHGTKFSLNLGPPTQFRAVAKTTDIDMSITSVSLANLHILLVDDSDINTEIAQAILQAQGAIIHTASDGIQAIKILSRLPHVDIILMDKHMPNLNGIEATRQIRDMYHPEQMPITIALTADAFEVDNEEWFGLGLTDLITKPFDAELLIKTVSRALKKKLNK